MAGTSCYFSSEGSSKYPEEKKTQHKSLLTYPSLQLIVMQILIFFY